MADLEDAAFPRCLPLARTLAHAAANAATGSDRAVLDRLPNSTLAKAVLAWRQSTSVGFRRFARSSIIRVLASL